MHVAWNVYRKQQNVYAFPATKEGGLGGVELTREGLNQRFDRTGRNIWEFIGNPRLVEITRRGRASVDMCFWRAGWLAGCLFGVDRDAPLFASRSPSGASFGPDSPEFFCAMWFSGPGRICRAEGVHRSEARMLPLGEI